ncbi:MAG: hypothetical protein KF684_10270 [Phycisphaeraceae bacterium]|nr:hypothetical protein [Phycisphaeraceae bacterium]
MTEPHPAHRLGEVVNCAFVCVGQAMRGAGRDTLPHAAFELAALFWWRWLQEERLSPAAFRELERELAASETTVAQYFVQLVQRRAPVVESFLEVCDPRVAANAGISADTG